MSLAAKIANIHTDRDNEIFDHLVGIFDSQLNDPVWVLSHKNYSRNDDNEIRYDFETGTHLRAFIDQTERPWISPGVKIRLCAHYRALGFEARINTMDQLELVVDGNELGEDDDAGGADGA